MVTPGEHGPDSSPSARREQIVKAARAAIEEHGPNALTGQIAERAGLARPNFYRHFASKDDLDLAVARSAAQELRAGIRKVDFSGAPLDVIRAVIAAQVIWAGRHPNLYRFLVSRRYHNSAQNRQAELGEYTGELAAAAARHLPRFGKSPNVAASVVIALGGLLDASILDWLTRRSEARKHLIDRLTAYVWLVVEHELREAGVSVDPTVPLAGADPPRK